MPLRSSLLGHNVPCVHATRAQAPGNTILPPLLGTMSRTTLMKDAKQKLLWYLPIIHLCDVTKPLQPAVIKFIMNRLCVIHHHQQTSAASMLSLCLLFGHTEQANALHVKNGQATNVTLKKKPALQSIQEQQHHTRIEYATFVKAAYFLLNTSVLGVIHSIL